MGFIGQRVTPAPTCFFQTQAIRVPGFRPVVFPFCWFDKIIPPGGFWETLDPPSERRLLWNAWGTELPIGVDKKRPSFFRGFPGSNYIYIYIYIATKNTSWGPLKGGFFWKGSPLISQKSRLVKYYHLTTMDDWDGWGRLRLQKGRKTLK